MDRPDERTTREQLLVQMHDRPAGILTREEGGSYTFVYLPGYAGPPISVTMPVRTDPYPFAGFPPFFDGLLPEGVLLEALLRRHKLDATDYMRQLEAVGEDMVGAVTVTAMADEGPQENAR